MSTQLPENNDLDSFIEFLTRQAENRGRDMSPEESVEEYRAYQAEVQQLRERIQSSIDSGDAKPLDHEALMQRVRERLAKEGLTD